MGHVFFFSWEIDLISWIQAHLGSLGTFLANMFSFLGEEYLLILILSALYFCCDRKKARQVLLPVILGAVSCPLIKNLAFRKRPYMASDQVQALRPIDPSADLHDPVIQGFSFPSGHSVNATTLYGSLPCICKQRILQVLAIALPILVGISRVATGNHFPTDVLFGWVLGICLVLISQALLHHTKRLWLLYLVLFLIGCLGFIYCRTEDYFSAIGLMAGFFLGDLTTDFELPAAWWRGLLRVVLGIALFLVVNTVLKKLFGPVLLFRSLRYAIDAFVLLAVYPRSFRKLRI